MARTKKKLQDEQRQELQRFLAQRGGRGGRSRGRPRSTGREVYFQREQHRLSSVSQSLDQSLSCGNVSSSTCTKDVPEVVSHSSLPCALLPTTGNTPASSPTASSSERASPMQTERHSPRILSPATSPVKQREGSNVTNSHSGPLRKKTARKSTTTLRLKRIGTKFVNLNVGNCDSEDVSPSSGNTVQDMFDRFHEAGPSNRNATERGLIEKLGSLSKPLITVFNNVEQAVQNLGNRSRTPLVCMQDVMRYESETGYICNSSSSPMQSNSSLHSIQPCTEEEVSDALAESWEKTSVLQEENKASGANDESVKQVDQNTSARSLHTDSKKEDSARIPQNIAANSTSAASCTHLNPSDMRSEKRKRSPNVRLGSDMILLPWHTTRKTREKPNVLQPSPRKAGKKVQKSINISQAKSNTNTELSDTARSFQSEECLPLSSLTVAPEADPSLLQDTRTDNKISGNNLQIKPVFKSSKCADNSVLDSTATSVKNTSVTMTKSGGSLCRPPVKRKVNLSECSDEAIETVSESSQKVDALTELEETELNTVSVKSQQENESEIVSSGEDCNVSSDSGDSLLKLALTNDITSLLSGKSYIPCDHLSRTNNQRLSSLIDRMTARVGATVNPDPTGQSSEEESISSLQTSPSSVKCATPEKPQDVSLMEETTQLNLLQLSSEEERFSAAKGSVSMQTSEKVDASVSCSDKNAEGYDGLKEDLNPVSDVGPSPTLKTSASLNDSETSLNDILQGSSPSVAVLTGENMKCEPVSTISLTKSGEGIKSVINSQITLQDEIHKLHSQTSDFSTRPVEKTDDQDIMNIPPDEDLMYGQRTREPAPLSVLSKVESIKSPKAISAFMSEDLDSYLLADENRKICLASLQKPQSMDSSTVNDDEKGSRSPVYMNMDVTDGEKTGEMPLKTVINPVHPDFDDIEGMLFVSFDSKEAMAAHIRIETQNHWDDNHFHFLDMCKIQKVAEIKNKYGISGKLPKALREKEQNFSATGMHMKWRKYLRIFRKELSRTGEIPVIYDGLFSKDLAKTTDITKIKGWKSKYSTSKSFDNVLGTENTTNTVISNLAETKTSSLSGNLPVQQMGKLHWRTEQRLLRSLAPADIKEMGLELKKKRRKSMIFTRRKGSSVKFESRIGRFGRVQKSKFGQNDEYYYYDDEAKYYEDDCDTSKQKTKEAGRTAGTNNTESNSGKKPSVTKKLMKKYNLCGLKKLRKMWKRSVREGRLAYMKKVEASEEMQEEFPVLTESMALQAVTALDFDILGVLPRDPQEVLSGEENVVEEITPYGDGQSGCGKPGCRYGCVCHLFRDRAVPGSKGSDSDELTKEDPPSIVCDKEYCQLGCICSSLERQLTDKETHCGKPECMFGCKCGNGLDSNSTADLMLSIGRDSSDDIPKLQAVTDPLKSPESCESLLSPEPLPEELPLTQLTSSDSSEPSKKPALKKKFADLPKRVGSQRVAKNLDAITRKALMYMDPQDLYPKQKRQRKRKAEAATEGDVKGKTSCVTTIKRDVSKNEKAVYRKADKRAEVLIDGVDSACTQYGEARNTDTADCSSTYADTCSRTSLFPSNRPVAVVKTESEKDWPVKGRGVASRSKGDNPSTTVVYASSSVEVSTGSEEVTECSADPKVTSVYNNQRNVPVSRVTTKITAKRKEGRMNSELLKSSEDMSHSQEPSLVTFSCQSSNTSENSMQKKKRKRKQKLGRILSDESTPEKKSGNVKSQCGSGPEVKPYSEKKVSVTDKWSVHMVCLKPSRKKSDASSVLQETENDQHLLEFKSNCSWDTCRTTILSRIARCLKPGVYPQEQEFIVEDFTVNILPKAEKPATIPPDLRANCPSLMYPIRVTVTPTWFHRQKKAVQVSIPEKTFRRKEIAVKKEMTASQRLLQDRRTVTSSGPSSGTDKLTVCGEEKTLPVNSGISGLSHLKINNSFKAARDNNSFDDQQKSVFRLQKGQVVFQNEKSQMARKVKKKCKRSQKETDPNDQSSHSPLDKNSSEFHEFQRLASQRTNEIVNMIKEHAKHKHNLKEHSSSETGLMTDTLSPNSSNITSGDGIPTSLRKNPMVPARRGRPPSLHKSVSKKNKQKAQPEPLTGSSTTTLTSQHITSCIQSVAEMHTQVCTSSSLPVTTSLDVSTGTMHALGTAVEAVSSSYNHSSRTGSTKTGVKKPAQPGSLPTMQLIQNAKGLAKLLPVTTGVSVVHLVQPTVSIASSAGKGLTAGNQTGSTSGVLALPVIIKPVAHDNPTASSKTCSAVTPCTNSPLMPVKLGSHGRPVYFSPVPVQSGHTVLIPNTSLPHGSLSEGLTGTEGTVAGKDKIVDHLSNMSTSSTATVTTSSAAHGNMSLTAVTSSSKGEETLVSSTVIPEHSVKGIVDKPNPKLSSGSDLNEDCVIEVASSAEKFTDVVQDSMAQATDLLGGNQTASEVKADTVKLSKVDADSESPVDGINPPAGQDNVTSDLDSQESLDSWSDLSDETEHSPDSQTGGDLVMSSDEECVTLSEKEEDRVEVEDVSDEEARSARRRTKRKSPLRLLDSRMDMIFTEALTVSREQIEAKKSKTNRERCRRHRLKVSFSLLRSLISEKRQDDAVLPKLQILNKTVAAIHNLNTMKQSLENQLKKERERHKYLQRRLCQISAGLSDSELRDLVCEVENEEIDLKESDIIIVEEMPHSEQTVDQDIGQEQVTEYQDKGSGVQILESDEESAVCIDPITDRSPSSVEKQVLEHPMPSDQVEDNSIPVTVVLDDIPLEKLKSCRTNINISPESTNDIEKQPTSEPFIPLHTGISGSEVGSPKKMENVLTNSLHQSGIVTPPSTLETSVKDCLETDSLFEVSSSVCPTTNMTSCRQPWLSADDSDSVCTPDSTQQPVINIDEDGSGIVELHPGGTLVLQAPDTTNTSSLVIADVCSLADWTEPP